MSSGETEFKDLELRLLDPSVRENRDLAAGLLCDGFREFGSSGRVFDKTETLDAIEAGQAAEIAVSDFRWQSLAPDAVLVTYRSVRNGGSALRSSIWVRRQDRWQMLFHQGTRVPPTETADLS